MNSLSKRLNSHFASCAAVAAAAVAASTASAQVVWHTYGTNGIQVPATGAGLYFNLLTGATGSSGSSVGGPYMNPYGSSTSFIQWWAPTGDPGTWRGVNIGNYSNEVSNLGLGFTVGSSIPNSGAAGTPRFNSTATTSGQSSWAGGDPGDFSLNALNYFGFRFQVDTATHYGFGVMRMGASITERYMMGFAFESTAGASITTTAVPAPGALALLGAVGLMGSRRRRAA